MVTLQMTRQTALERGLLFCSCGHPENNHFDHGTTPCAHCSCKAYEERPRPEMRFVTQPPPAPAEAPAMPTAEAFPVRLVLDLRDHDEHLEMVQLAREVGLDFDAWALKVLRAAAKEAKMRR